MAMTPGEKKAFNKGFGFHIAKDENRAFVKLPDAFDKQSDFALCTIIGTN